jgi:DNA mismatch repair ATPase MutS
VRAGSFRQLSLGRLDITVRRGSADALRSLLDALYTLDALQSLARASTTPGFAYPEIVESRDPVFSVRRAFHPLVRAPQPCDVDLHAGARVVFLTGPNMAGKTTYLKTCGVIAVLAHLGMAVPAATSRLSVFDTLFAVLSVHDSLDRGESSFLAEVRRVGDLVGRLARGERVLALADEMFKGTNVLDAHTATEFTVSRFARCAKSLFLVSSHLVELADPLSRVEGIAFWHFDADVEGDRLVFTFHLKPGASSQRLGMKLLEREGVAELLDAVQRAQAV